MTEPRLFRNGAALRAWLVRHHAGETERLLRAHKTGSRLGSITYAQALDEALASGWINGVRRRIHHASYSIRFTPRQARNVRSAVNVERVAELTAEGRIEPAARAAFEKRDEKRTAIYSYERGGARPQGELLERFMSDDKAWSHYEARAPWYTRTAALWGVSANKEETRMRRLEKLIACSRRGERLDTLTPSTKRSKAK